MLMNQTIASTTTYLILALLATWLSVVTYLFIRAQSGWREITKGIVKKDLKTILTHLDAAIKSTRVEVSSLQKEVQLLHQDGKSHYQKLGCVRFNPFLDTGGNQSFSLCLLDDHNNGIVITSLHSRDATRLYVKEITRGSSDGRELSREEQQAVKEALKRK